MDSMQVNKAIAAVLVSGIAFMGATIISQSLVHPHLLATSAIKVEGSGPAVAAAPAEDPPVETLLVSADASKGQSDTQAAGCVACHSFNQGGKAGVGPNLYGVVGGPKGHMQGYDYSAALKGKGGSWTYDDLYEWLKKPSAYAPGTKMTYAGLADPNKRAEVISYLRSLSATPEPLPTAAPAKPGAKNAAAAPAAAAPAAVAPTTVAPGNGAPGSGTATTATPVAPTQKQ